MSSIAAQTTPTATTTETSTTTATEKVSHNTESISDSVDHEKEYNVFRDSPIRYMGYANEIGESFRYQFPKLVTPTYIVAFGYCTMDAITTGYRVWSQEPATNETLQERKQIQTGAPTNRLVVTDETKRRNDTMIATFDTLLWQSLASVMIPGAIINTIVKASRFAIARAPPAVALPLIFTKWFPTMAGLGSIPFIVHPIDALVDFSMDNTTRRWINSNSQDDDETGL